MGIPPIQSKMIVITTKDQKAGLNKGLNEVLRIYEVCNKGNKTNTNIDNNIPLILFKHSNHSHEVLGFSFFLSKLDV